MFVQNELIFIEVYNFLVDPVFFNFLHFFSTAFVCVLFASEKESSFFFGYGFLKTKKIASFLGKEFFIK